MAAVQSAPVEAKQEAPRQGRIPTTETRAARKTGKTDKAGKTGKTGKAGKSFAAALLSKLSGQAKGGRSASSPAAAGKASDEKLLAVQGDSKNRRLLRHSASYRLQMPAAEMLPGLVAAGEGKAAAADQGRGRAERLETAAVSSKTAKAGRRARPQLVILDLRRPGADKKMQGQRAQAEPAAKTADSAQSDMKGLNTVRLVGRGAGAPAGELAFSASLEQATTPVRDTGTFSPQTMLRTWQESMIPEVVKRTGIIVRDGGEGEIRLILKPESLGNVRIRITIENNSVEGRIVVENNSVKELFDASLDNLKASLRQEGFQSASLEVSVGNQRTRQEAENRQQAVSSLELEREEAADEFDRFVPPAGVWAGAEYTVNLVV